MSNTEPIVFRRIPTLRHLFRAGGRPGVSYAIIPPEELPQAEAAGYRMIQGAKSFTIEGPKGKAAAIVVGKGRPVRGIRPDSFVCPLHVHKRILDQTGFDASGQEVKDGQESRTQGSAAPQNRVGAGRVQERKAAQQ